MPHIASREDHDEWEQEEESESYPIKAFLTFESKELGPGCLCNCSNCLHWFLLFFLHSERVESRC